MNAVRWRSKRRYMLPPLVFAALMLLASCGFLLTTPVRASAPGAAATPIVLHAPETHSTAHPKGEQTLRLAGPIDGPASLDPATAGDASTAFLVHQIFRGLTQLDADLRPQPELAKTITISPDGLSYTFALQPDASFQDGHPVTAADVVFSLTRALSPATTGGDASQLAGPTYLMDIAGAADIVAGRTSTLRGVTAIDSQTVRITLAAPRTTFLMKLASAPASIVEQSDVGRGGEWWKQPAGSGPFKVSTWQPNQQMVLTRYDKFFAGAPPLAKVTIALGPNAQQPFNLYQAGKLDVAMATSDVIDRITDPASAFRHQVVKTPLFAVDYIAFSPNVAPMDDPHIRRAIQLAFPRDKVADLTFNGNVRPAAGLIPQGMLDRQWPIEYPTYDLAKAKEEIAASKYKTAANVPTLRIYGANYSAAESLRDVLQSDLGLKVDVVAVDWSDYLTGLARRDFPAYELYWLADYPDPEDLLEMLFGSTSAANYIGYHNPAFDQLMDQAEREHDAGRRDALLAQAQQLLIDDGVVLPIYNDVEYTLVQPTVKGLHVTPLGIIDLDGVWLEH